jgi:hypothetical protein
MNIADRVAAAAIALFWAAIMIAAIWAKFER